MLDKKEVEAPTEPDTELRESARRIESLNHKQNIAKPIALSDALPNSNSLSLLEFVSFYVAARWWTHIWVLCFVYECEVERCTRYKLLNNNVHASLRVVRGAIDRDT